MPKSYMPQSRMIIFSKSTCFITCILLIALLLPVFPSSDKAVAATGELILCSCSSTGEPGNDQSIQCSSNADGTKIAFISLASNLVDNDEFRTYDVFFKNLENGEVIRCSASSNGDDANGLSCLPEISANGRYVVFRSIADNLIPGDDNGHTDIFRKDVITGEIVCCSTDSSDILGNGDSDRPSINTDGKYVTFHSEADNLIPGDVNGCSDVFRKDLDTGEILCCSTSLTGEMGNNESYYSSINGDGRYVAFASGANNLIPNDQNDSYDVVRKDLITGEIACCSTNSSGVQGNGGSPSISADGRYVVFSSNSTNLVPHDDNGYSDVFRKDLITNETRCCSEDKHGNVAPGGGRYPKINADGRYVAFTSGRLVQCHEAGRENTYRKDLVNGEVLYCSAYISGEGINESCASNDISGDGRYVFFSAEPHTFYPGTPEVEDVFRKKPIMEPPCIASLSVNSGVTGDEVEIHGSNFGNNRGDSYITFGTIQITKYSSWSDTKIKFVIPREAYGIVGVRVFKDLGISNEVDFRVHPHIDYLEPDTGTVGSEFSIIGTGFGPTIEDSEIEFDRIRIDEVISWSNYQIKLNVPAGGEGENDVQIIDTNGSCSNKEQYTIIPYVVGFAEGYTGNGFQEYLCIGNPHDASTNCEIIYLFPNGTYMENHLSLSSYSRTTVNVNEDVGPDQEVSVLVISRLEVVVERPMYFNYKGKWSGGHNVVATPYISKLWFFAEGYTGPGFEEWICVLNPNPDPANLTLHFQTEEEGQITRTEGVGPLSRASFNINELLGNNYQCSLVLESDQFVLAERSIYFDYTGFGNYHWDGGHCVLGLTYLNDEYYFAEGTTRSGFDEWLTLQNPFSNPITIIATYQLGSGLGPPVIKSYIVPPESRYTVYVPDEVGKDKDVSVKLSSSDYFLAERPMYFHFQGYGVDADGGHCVIGASELADEWFFAEGYTGGGFQEWLCLQNPSDSNAEVAINYIRDFGGFAYDIHNIPPNTRTTIRVNNDAGDDMELSCHLLVISGPPIMAERPMYFNFFGMDGGHDVIGYNPGTSMLASSSYRTASLDDVFLLRDLNLNDLKVSLNNE